MPDAEIRLHAAAPRRPRRRLQKLALALCVALVSLEVGLRVFDVGLPMARIWRWHPTLGWSQNPSWTYDYTIDGDRVHNEFNALGFRDTEHTLAKPPGTRRIVVLGDSFCEALQVDLEDTFFRLLEARLDARGDGDYETINLGVGDWGQGQQLIALRDIGLGFAPDLVICEVFPLNDLCNNTIELFGLGKSHNDVYRPYFVEQGGELVATWHDPFRQRLRRFSRVFLNPNARGSGCRGRSNPATTPNAGARAGARPVSRGSSRSCSPTCRMPTSPKRSAAAGGRPSGC